MLWKASTLKGYAIAASDGPIGIISDFLFDDVTWRVRWLVVDTGTWLSSRKVLLPPSALGHPHPHHREFSVRLTRTEVKESPDIDTDKSVSRQMESSVYDHYGWSSYWGAGIDMGGFGLLPPIAAESEAPGCWDREDSLASGSDPHLRSTTAVTSYHIHARDGEIGHVEDFLVADGDWSIHYLIVDTKNWWPGKKVLVAPNLATGIDWANRLVNLTVARQDIMNAPAYDDATVVDRAYERNFHGHYQAGHKVEISEQDVAAELADRMNGRL